MILGINNFSPTIREKLLQRRLGLYPLTSLTELDNDEYNINIHAPFIDKYVAENGILEYTNTLNVRGSSDGYNDNVRRGKYGKQWDKHNDETSVDIYRNIELPSNKLVSKWDDEDRNKFDNYLDYVKYVYGTDSSLVNVLGGIVSGDGVGLSLGNNSVGVISNFDIQQTLSGRIYSTVTGKDTPLGKFGVKAAAVSMLNSAIARTTKDPLAQTFDWLKGKVTFWDKSDDSELDFSDTSITVEKKGNKTINLFGKDIDLGINNEITNYIGEILGVYNSATKSRLEDDSSIFDQDHYGSSFKILPNYKLFLQNFNNPLDRFSYLIDSKTRNEELIANTGKLSVGFIYNALNLNKFSPNYDIDNRFKKAAIVPTQSYIESMGNEHNYTSFNIGNGMVRGTDAWQEKKETPDAPYKDYLDGMYYGIDNNRFQNQDSLLSKTKDLFKSFKVNTIVSGFSDTNAESSDIQSATNQFWGISKGRNLLKKHYWQTPYIENESDKSAGYINPYCRVWTWHKQYRKVTDLIRPFIDDNDEVVDVHKNIPFIRPGANSLKNYGVLQDNGFLKITPYSSDRNGDIKQYMFSIENLAWMDSFIDYNLCDSQKGPNGGRIMWFPPYGLQFNENVNASWNSNQFIGRGEPVYTYSNTERTGTLSFMVLADHSSIINYNKKVAESPDDKEQSLLRFHAGCDVLEAQDLYPKDLSMVETELKHTQTKGNNDSSSSTDVNNTLNTQNTEIVNENMPPSSDPIVLFNVFFPNDYSGIDEGSDSAMSYLVNDGYEISNKPSASNVVDGILTVIGSGEKVDGFTCSANNSLVTSNNWITKYKSNWYKRDNISNYGARNTNNSIDVGKLPRAKYNQLISYWDVGNFQLNSLPQGNAKYGFEEVYNMLLSQSGDEYNNFVSLIKEAKEVRFYGSADANGYATDNKKLGMFRAEMVRDFVSKYTRIDMSNTSKFKVDCQPPRIGLSDTTYVACASSKDFKMKRNVEISIIKEDVTVVPLEEAVQPIDENGVLTVKKTTFESQAAYDYAVRNKLQAIYGDDATRKRIPKPRYDEEKGFFEKLSLLDDAYQDKIREKIRYFQPAFHSTTPEGLNARLTFLHQCTRQGPTTTLGDKNSTSASNLAFGRPPICILRIGDFYNTKVIIDSMSINYEPLLWDLNPEGVGVQPMLANVTLNFKFLGGSDLTGPIARLQNAITYNFYANTSVYDDRSDYLVEEKGGVSGSTNDDDINGNTLPEVTVTNKTINYAPLYDPYEYANVSKIMNNTYKINGEYVGSDDDITDYIIQNGIKASTEHRETKLDDIKPTNPLDSDFFKTQSPTIPSELPGIKIKTN